MGFMTLNVIFQRGGVYAMIGDLMLTSDEARTDIPIIFPPTPRTPLDPADIKRHYAGLEQKLTTINSHLTVAWAGPVHVARRAIDKLKVGCATPQETAANLGIMLDDFIDDPDMAELSLTAVSVSEEKTAQLTAIRPLIIQRDPLLIAAGSGWEDAREPLLQMYETMRFDESDINDIQRAKLMALSWTGLLTQMQIRDREAAKKWYGGGYEIAITESSGVNKLDRILHLLFGVDRDENGQDRLTLGYPVISQFYHGADLVFRYMYPKECYEHVIRGYGSTNNPIDEPLDFTPSYTTFAFEKPDTSKHYTSHIKCADAPVSIAARTGHLSLLVNQPLIFHILNMTGAGSAERPPAFD